MDNVTGGSIRETSSMGSLGGGLEEPSNTDKIKTIVDIASGLLKVFSWLLGSSTPRSVRTLANVATSIDNTERILRCIGGSRGTTMRDGSLSAIEYLEYNRSLSYGNIMRNVPIDDIMQTPSFGSILNKN